MGKNGASEVCVIRKATMYVVAFSLLQGDGLVMSLLGTETSIS